MKNTEKTEKNCPPNMIHTGHFRRGTARYSCRNVTCAWMDTGTLYKSSSRWNNDSRARSAYRLAVYNRRRTRGDSSVRESLEVNHIRQQLIKIKLDTNNELLKLAVMEIAASDATGVAAGARSAPARRCAQRHKRWEQNYWWMPVLERQIVTFWSKFGTII